MITAIHGVLQHIGNAYTGPTEWEITASGAWTAPTDGSYTILLYGAGGGGGGGASDGYGGGGGGTAGYRTLTQDLVKDTEYSITIGNGGYGGAILGGAKAGGVGGQTKFATSSGNTLLYLNGGGGGGAGTSKSAGSIGSAGSGSGASSGYSGTSTAGASRRYMDGITTYAYGGAGGFESTGGAGGKGRVFITLNG